MSPFLQQLRETTNTPGNSFSDSWAGIKASKNNWENDNVPPKYCWGKKALLCYSTSKRTAGQAIESMLAAFPRRLVLLGSVYNKAQWGDSSEQSHTLWKPHNPRLSPDSGQGTASPALVPCALILPLVTKRTDTRDGHPSTASSWEHSLNPCPLPGFPT